MAKILNVFGKRHKKRRRGNDFVLTNYSGHLLLHKQIEAIFCTVLKFF
mgnify:CR=1 FL=1|jgi:hypothetical protein